MKIEDIDLLKIKLQISQTENARLNYELEQLRLELLKNSISKKYNLQDQNLDLNTGNIIEKDTNNE